MSTSREGFWESKEEPYLPHPREFQRETPVDAAWLEKFAEVEFWASKDYFLGYSHCRLCDKDNGCATFVIEQGPDTWCFPEGLCHYFKEHNVHPSRAFYKFVLAYRRPTVDEFVNSLVPREQEMLSDMFTSMQIAVSVKAAIAAADQYPQDIQERLQSPTFVDSLPAQIQMHLKDGRLLEKFRELCVQRQLQQLLSGVAEVRYSD
jgi:hypothetical protein